MGLAGGGDIEVQFFQDIDVTFTLSGTTDNGLTFGAAIDLDEGGANTTTNVLEDAVGIDLNGDGDTDDTVNISSPNAAMGNNFDDGGVAVFISGGFGTVTMGDTDGAMDWALTEAGNMGNPGSIEDNETSHDGYLGSYLDGFGDGQIVRYDNSFGDFGVAVSVEQDADAEEFGYAVGLRYSLEVSGAEISLGAGFQNAVDDDVQIFGVSAVVKTDTGLTGGLVYAQGDDDSHLGIGLGYEAGAFSMHANYGEYDSGDSGYGLAAAYDLGGGLGAKFGYNDAGEYSLGLAMSF